MSGSCCAPGRDPHQAPREPSSAAAVPVTTSGGAAPGRGLVPLVPLSGGTFLMGSETRETNVGDGEGPVRPVTLRPYAIGRTTVTNDQFAAFVADTDHRTGADRFGWSFVFAGFLPGALRKGAERVPDAPWWCRVDGASWQHPEGPGSDLSGRGEHPVVHVDHDDALAFCAWAGLRLPTEAEWEHAARGGLEQATYSWGDELLPDGEHRCNIWQGRFPTSNTRDDGYAGTAPADAFSPNGFGLHNVAGNVWEWCADWWGTDHTAAPQTDPLGPAAGTARVMRGGSYLCHDSYCNRYRVAARTSNDPDSASGNLGFRVAADIGLSRVAADIGLSRVAADL